jgi:NCS1 family nucleobase:cation symporter-1
VSFIGIIVSSSSVVLYGEAIWSPIDLLGKLLDGNPSGGTRFGVWFISASFILAQASISRIMRLGTFESFILLFFFDSLGKSF